MLRTTPSVGRLDWRWLAKCARQARREETACRTSTSRPAGDDDDDDEDDEEGGPRRVFAISSAVRPVLNCIPSSLMPSLSPPSSFSPSLLTRILAALFAPSWKKEAILWTVGAPPALAVAGGGGAEASAVAA